MSAYTFRKLESSEFDVLIVLMKDCFGVNVNIDYFRWKYLENPVGEFIGFIAIENETGEIGAYYGVIPQLYSIRGEEVVIYQSCDTMTHSAHRRRGLFNDLARTCYDYLREQGKLFVIGFGGTQSTPGLMKMGWVEAFKVRYYVFPGLLQPVARVRSVFLGKALKNVEKITDVSLIEQLLLGSNACAAVHSVRNRAIYNWRIKSPLQHHEIIAYKERDNRYTGYICYKREKNKISVLDFGFEQPAAARVLFTCLKNMLKRGDKGIVAFCQEQSALSRVLLQNGFVNNPFSRGPLSSGAPFVFLSTVENMERFQAPSNWLVNSFDHDAT